MRAILYLIIVAAAITVGGCQKKRCAQIGIEKLDYREGCADSNDVCVAYYAAGCVDMESPADVDTLNMLVAKAYCESKYNPRKYYGIMVVKYDLSGENGINNQSDLGRDGGSLRNENPEWWLAYYSWHDRAFNKSSVASGDSGIDMRPNMDSMVQVWRQRGCRPADK